MRSPRALILLLLIVLVINSSLCAKRKPSRKLKRSARRCFESLCSEPSIKYPTSKIKKLLVKHKEAYKKLSGTILEPFQGINPAVLRSSAAVYEENLCDSIRYQFFPKYDKEYNLTIVNVDGFQQALSFDVCGERKNCVKSFLLDHQTSCKQLYNNVRLLYLDENNQLSYRLFTVPNACVCVYSKQNYFYNKET